MATKYSPLYHPETRKTQAGLGSPLPHMPQNDQNFGLAPFADLVHVAPVSDEVDQEPAFGNIAGVEDPIGAHSELQDPLPATPQPLGLD